MTKESTQRTALIEKIGTLPPEQQAEVENFVDFLASKQRRRAALGVACFQSLPRWKRRKHLPQTTTTSSPRLKKPAPTDSKEKELTPDF